MPSKKDAVILTKGIGYINEIHKSANAMHVGINVIQKFDADYEHVDMIWINCRTEDKKLFCKIAALNQSLVAERAVIVKFEVQIKKFTSLHNSVPNQKIGYIIEISGKLIELKKCYVG